MTPYSHHRSRRVDRGEALPPPTSVNGEHLSYNQHDSVPYLGGHGIYKPTRPRTSDRIAGILARARAGRSREQRQHRRGL